MKKAVLISLGLAFLCSTGHTSRVVFDAGLAYAGFDGPCASAAADFNNDNIPDLATVSYYDNTLSVLLTDPDGVFQAWTGLPVDTGDKRLAAADFDNDGDVDLAVTQRSTAAVTIFLNNGDATFDAGTRINVQYYPMGIVATDLDGDLDQDLVIANSIDGVVNDNVQPLINDGAGNFSVATPFGDGQAGGRYEGVGLVPGPQEVPHHGFFRGDVGVHESRGRLFCCRN